MASITALLSQAFRSDSCRKYYGMIIQGRLGLNLSPSIDGDSVKFKCCTHTEESRIMDLKRKFAYHIAVGKIDERESSSQRHGEIMSLEPLNREALGGNRPA